MGYLTAHKLTILQGDFSLIEELRDFSEDASFNLDSHGETCELGKWYRHEGDMRAFSKMHPEAIFKLEGDGEDRGDVWQEFYQNGKMQRCDGNQGFESFDIKKLS